MHGMDQVLLPFTIKKWESYHVMVLLYIRMNYVPIFDNAHSACSLHHLSAWSKSSKLLSQLSQTLGCELPFKFLKKAFVAVISHGTFMMILQ